MWVAGDILSEFYSQLLSWSFRTYNILKRCQKYQSNFSLINGEFLLKKNHVLQSQLLRAFWRNSETSEPCWRAPRSCLCHMLIIKWRFRLMRNLLIKTTKKILFRKNWNHCMHVMILQIPQFLFVFLLLNRWTIRNVLIAEFESAEKYTRRCISRGYLYAATACKFRECCQI